MSERRWPVNSRSANASRAFVPMEWHSSNWLTSSGVNFFEQKNSLRRETVDLSRFPEAGDYGASVKMN
jgi:murein tripeptide amidase MpaA